MFRGLSGLQGCRKTAPPPPSLLGRKRVGRAGVRWGRGARVACTWTGQQGSLLTDRIPSVSSVGHPAGSFRSNKLHPEPPSILTLGLGHHSRLPKPPAVPPSERAGAGSAPRTPQD